MEISKNLLQMNFMRKTALAVQKESVEDNIESVDPDKWTVQLPDIIKNHLKKAVAMKSALKKTRGNHMINSAYAIQNITPGGRFSFRNYNPVIEKLMESKHSLNDTSNEVSITDTEMAAINDIFRRQKRSAKIDLSDDEDQSNANDIEEGEVVRKKRRKKDRRKPKNKHDK